MIMSPHYEQVLVLSNNFPKLTNSISPYQVCHDELLSQMGKGQNGAFCFQ